MINSQRYTALEAIESAGRTLREHVSQEEMQRMTYLANKRYDERISLYEQGKKQWDTQVCVMMVIRGEKK